MDNRALRDLDSDRNSELRDKLVVLRLFRLGKLPPALSSVELLAESGLPVLVVEYGNVHEEKLRVGGAFLKLRLPMPWAGKLPRRLQPPAIWLGTLLELAVLFRKQGRPKLILAEGIAEQAMAFWLKKITGTPYAVHVHEIYDAKDLSGTTKLYFAMEGPALREASFLIFPERERSEIYKKRYGLKCPLFIAYNCPRLRPSARRREERARWNLPKDARVMAYVGGIGPSNVLECGIEALAEVPGVHFFLWGWGEPAYLDSLKALARSRGVQDRVHFQGEVSHEGRWTALEASDIGYCLYRPDELRIRHQATASNKLMEFLALGLPVITSSSPDFKAVVESHDVGACAAEISPKGVAEALKALLKDEPAFLKKSRNALELHRKSFHYEAQFKEALVHFQTFFGSDKT